MPSYPSILLCTSIKVRDDNDHDVGPPNLTEGRATSISESDNKEPITLINDNLLTPVHTSYYKKASTPCNEDFSLENAACQSSKEVDTTSPSYPSLASRLTSIFLLISSGDTHICNDLFPKFVTSLKTQQEYESTWSIILDSVIASSKESSSGTVESINRQCCLPNMIQLSTCILQHYNHNENKILMGMRTLHKLLNPPCESTNNGQFDNSSSKLIDGQRNMAIINLLQEYCRRYTVYEEEDLLNTDTNNIPKATSSTAIRPLFMAQLFSYFFKPLVHILAVSKKRTNISVMAMDTALLLLDRTCEEVQVVTRTSDKQETNKSESILVVDPFDTCWNARFNAYLSILDHLSDVLTLIRTKKQWSAGLSSSGAQQCSNSEECDDRYTRQECALSVLSDFESILLTTQKQYQECCIFHDIHNKQRQNMKEEVTNQNATIQAYKTVREISLHICWQLRGAPIAVSCMGGSKQYIIYLGGFQQCLSSRLGNNKAHSSEPIDHLCWASTISSSHSYSGSLSASTSSINGELNDYYKDFESSEIASETQRSVARFFSAWLASKNLRALRSAMIKKKNDKSIVMSKGLDTIYANDLLPRSIQALLILLTSKSDCCVHFALVSLNRLWAIASKLNSSTVITSLFSIDYLLDLLKDQSDLSLLEEKELTAPLPLDPSSRAACVLIVRLVQSHPKGLLPKLVADTIPSAAKIEIMSSLASANNCSVFTSKDDQTYISDLLVKELLAIMTHPRLQMRCRESPVFSYFPPDKVLPELLRALSCNSYGTQMASAAAAYISQIISHSVDSSQAVDILVKTLCKYETEEGPDGEMLHRCIVYAPMWRRSLLSESTANDRFATIIEALIRSMFQVPSMIAPLLLFGEIIGDGSGIIVSREGDHTNTVLESVAIVILKMGQIELKRTSSLRYDNKREKELLYERLSPILMLRRVPFHYFKLLHKYIDTTTDRGISLIIWKLGLELMCRLNISSGAEKNNVSDECFTADEKRLCAELVGRVLPIYVRHEGHTSSHPAKSAFAVNSFDRIFIPAFSRMMHACFGESISGSQPVNFSNGSIGDTMRDCRTALFIACHQVRLADDSDYGAPLLATVGFALNIISFSPDNMPGKETDAGFDQLQTGCMDFLAFCVESWSTRCKVSNALIQELSSVPSKSNNAENASKIWNGDVCDTLSYTIDVVLRFALTGVYPRSWYDVNCWFRGLLLEGQFIRLGRETTETGQSINSRVCCINAISLAAQRRPDEDETIIIMAKRFIPIFISWGRSIKILNDSWIHHPLCIAAVQQAAFILIMKVKSLQCCFIQDSASKDEISFLLKWALDAAKGRQLSVLDSTDDMKRAVKAMRVSGFKLLVALVTVDQLTRSKCNSFADSDEIGDAVAFLNGACNIDQDEDIRKLAIHFLNALGRA